jgi:hypothetical protein
MMDNFKILFMGGVSGKCKAGYDGSTYDSEGICPSLMTTIITGAKLFILVRDEDE